ncbi:MAG: hypothetical protein Q4A41_01885 [Bacillota bacterium]|nr:hypothetical protein [Bacillota bacterium]
MNPVRQLLRNPLLSSALCVLLTVSFAFLTLSTGVFSTAVNTVNELNRRFSVMAYPNSEWSYEVTKYPLKARRFFDNIKVDRNIVEAMHTLSFSNGNARNIRTLLSFEEYKKYNTHCDYPYDYVVFKIKMKKLHKPCEYTDYIFKNIDGEIKYEEQTKYMQKKRGRIA